MMDKHQKWLKIMKKNPIEGSYLKKMDKWLKWFAKAMDKPKQWNSQLKVMDKQLKQLILKAIDKLLK